MIRRTSFGAVFASLLFLVFAATVPTAGPVRLARHPDYHAGKIAFSYLGDIWVANEAGSDTRRLTDHRAREVYPRFSPDGKSIAFSSNRYGGYDVFIVPADGGAPRRLTFHSGNDDVVGWTRDGQNVIFRSTRGDGAFPSVATLYQIAVSGGQEKSLPVDWGYAASYSPDGKSLVFNRHPSSWSRRHYRGSYAADLWIADIAGRSYQQLLADERYNRFWPMWGADDAIYFVADPLPNDRSVKPGSPDVRRSVNNIFKIPSKGGQPVQVTKHTDGALFWPSMSSDGKVIVYEENFGIWKLDVASGRATEIALNIASDEKENQIDVETVTNEVDAFDISPSGRRAVVSVRGQILTIATERGDVTRLAPDDMVSRNQFPKWSPDGKYIAFQSDRSGRDEIWVADPEGATLKKITDLDNEKGALLWTPDSKGLLYTASDRKLYNYSVADGKTGVITSSDIGRIGSVAVSPDSKWVAFSKQDRTQRSHVYIAPLAGGEERHVSDDSVLYSESNAVWTADGQYLIFTSAEGFSNGIATQGGINTTMALWALSLRDLDRDPSNRDIDNEAQGLAAEAAARQNTGRGGSGAATPVEVRIDWTGMARRARQLTVPGTMMSGLTPAPEGHSIALTVSSAGVPTGRGGGGDESPSGNYIVNVESGQLTRLPPAPPQPGAQAAGRGGRGGGGFGAGGGMVFARDGRTLYFRSGTGLFAATVPQAAQPGGSGTGRGAGRGGGGGTAAASPETGATNATARQVSYTANIQIDRRQLRSQVFNEGWRIMKHRFYDAKMHGADWNATKKLYEPLLDYLVDTEELQSVMMMMIGHLNASHTGVSGGGQNPARTPQTRYPGFDLVADASGYYKVGHVYKDGPADRDHLKIADRPLRHPDRRSRAEDGRQLLAAPHAGRRQQIPLPAQRQADQGRRLERHDRSGCQRRVHRSPVRPLGGRSPRDGHQAERRGDRLPAHPGDGRPLPAPLPARSRGQPHQARAGDRSALQRRRRHRSGAARHPGRTAVSVHRRTRRRIPAAAAQNFYGPMVVMQNERSASDAEMFPAGFKALGLGKIIGVPTMGAVIGTGSYTLLDGSAIRTPGSGVWTVTGENMENYGVPPDVFVDNTPADFLKGRDAQIEKAIEVLKGELAAKKTSSPAQ